MIIEEEERNEKIITHCRWFKNEIGDHIGILFCQFGIIYLGLYSDTGGEIYEGGEAQIIHKNKLHTLLRDNNLTKRGWIRIAKKWAIDIWSPE